MLLKAATTSICFATEEDKYLKHRIECGAVEIADMVLLLL